MQAIGGLIEAILWLFTGFLIARLVIEWVQMFARSWTPRGPLLVLVELIFTITDPPIRFVRRFVPPLRIGQVAVDMAFVIVFVFVIVLRTINRAVFLM